MQTCFAMPASAAETGPDSGELKSVRIDTTGYRPARGLYRWPWSWSAVWTSPYGGRACHKTLTRTAVGQYGIGGCGMSIISGI